MQRQESRAPGQAGRKVPQEPGAACAAQDAGVRDASQDCRMASTRRLGGSGEGTWPLAPPGAAAARLAAAQSDLGPGTQGWDLQTRLAHPVRRWSPSWSPATSPLQRQIQLRQCVFIRCMQR
jgi:hypothetical protein